VSLVNLANVGQGGAGLVDKIPAAVKELQGLTRSFPTGAAAGVRASQTIALASVAAGQWFQVDGTAPDGQVVSERFTAVATAADVVPPGWNTFSISGNDTADGAAAVAAIAANPNASKLITAVNAAGTLTATAVAYGEDGNSYALTKSGAGITLGGANLAGGAGNVAITGFHYEDTVVSAAVVHQDTAAGGGAANIYTDVTSGVHQSDGKIQITGAGDLTGKQLDVLWLNKR